VPQLIEAVKRGVMLAGGLPMEFPTVSIHESFSAPTSMYLRNLMSIDTEEMVRAQPMDAVVVIGGCDKTLPAQVMEAVSAISLRSWCRPARWSSAFTGHDAGRLFSRREAKRRFTREEMDAWLKQRGVVLVGADLDESPMAYRRLPEVLAHHANSIRVLHTLRPFAVAMAGDGEYDPWKD